MLIKCQLIIIKHLMKVNYNASYGLDLPLGYIYFQQVPVCRRWLQQCYVPATHTPSETLRPAHAALKVVVAG